MGEPGQDGLRRGDDVTLARETAYAASALGVAAASLLVLPPLLAPLAVGLGSYAGLHGARRALWLTAVCLAAASLLAWAVELAL